MSSWKLCTFEKEVTWAKVWWIPCSIDHQSQHPPLPSCTLFFFVSVPTATSWPCSPLCTSQTFQLLEPRKGPSGMCNSCPAPIQSSPCPCVSRTVTRCHENGICACYALQPALLTVGHKDVHARSHPQVIFFLPVHVDIDDFPHADGICTSYTYRRSTLWVLTRLAPGAFRRGLSGICRRDHTYRWLSPCLCLSDEVREVFGQENSISSIRLCLKILPGVPARLAASGQKF